MGKAAVVLVCLTYLLVACAEGGAPQRAGASPTPAASDAPSPSPPSPSPAPSPACAPGAPRPGSLSADVDGDGSGDEVTLIAPALAGCPYLVVAETASGELSGELSSDLAGSAAGLPALNVAADLDRDGDSEVAVDVHAGASTVFLAVFDAAAGGLIRVRAAGGLGRGELFAYGGSVGHLDGIDCASEQSPAAGTVVMSSALAAGEGYVVRRSFYELVDGVLEHRPELRERLDVEPEDLGQFAELGSAPFSSCPS